MDDRGDRRYAEINAPFECEHKDAWLGKGYYFWDNSIHRAHDWGRNAYKGRYFFVQSQLFLRIRKTFLI
jgi:hypothetical protein